MTRFRQGSMTKDCVLTRCLLGLVASDRADHRVLVASDPVGGTLDIALCLCSIVLCLALRMLFATGLLPSFGTGHIANLRET